MARYWISLCRSVLLKWVSSAPRDILSQPLCPQRKLGLPLPKRQRQFIIQQPLDAVLLPIPRKDALPQRVIRLLHHLAVHTAPPTPLRTAPVAVDLRRHGRQAALEPARPQAPHAALFALGHLRAARAADVEQVLEVRQRVADVDDLEALGRAEGLDVLVEQEPAVLEAPLAGRGAAAGEVQREVAAGDVLVGEARDVVARVGARAKGLERVGDGVAEVELEVARHQGCEAEGGGEDVFVELLHGGGVVG